MSLAGRLRRQGDRLRAARAAVAAQAALLPPPPSAFAEFGAGSVIVAPARVDRPDLIHLGAGVVVHEHTWLSIQALEAGVTPCLRIGDRTRIGRFGMIACLGSVTIGTGVLISDNVFIGDTYHGYEDVSLPVHAQPMAPHRPVVIGDRAHIGFGAIVLRGVHIGEGAVVEPGSVVVADVPAGARVAGNPARMLGGAAR